MRVGEGDARSKLFAKKLGDSGFESSLDPLIVAFCVGLAGLVQIDEDFIAGTCGCAIDDLAYKTRNIDR